MKGCMPVVRCRANHSNPHFCGVQVRGSGYLPTAELSIRRGKMGAEGSSSHSNSCYQILPQVCVLPIGIVITAFLSTPSSLQDLQDL